MPFATKQTPTGAGAEKPEEIGLWTMALLGVSDLPLRQRAGNWDLLFQCLRRVVKGICWCCAAWCLHVGSS